MIRAIVALDSLDRLAGPTGIPWPRLTADMQYFRKHTTDSIVLMGYNTYQELPGPLPDRINVVASKHAVRLRPGFVFTNDAKQYIKSHAEDVWVIGGAKLLASVLDLMQEIYITRVDGDYGCTIFMPDYARDFIMYEQSPSQIQGNIAFRFTKWRRHSLPAEVAG